MSDHLKEFKDIMDEAHVEHTKSDEPKESMPGVDFPAVFDKKIELRKLLRKARGESEVEE